MTNGQSVITLKTLVPIGLVATLVMAGVFIGAHWEKIQNDDARLKQIEAQNIPRELAQINSRLAVIEYRLSIKTLGRAAIDSEPAATPLPPAMPRSRPRRAVAIVGEN